MNPLNKRFLSHRHSAPSRSRIPSQAINEQRAMKLSTSRGALLLQDVLSSSSPESLDRVRELQQRIKPDDGCTILFTSGTTGHPKGALLSHHNMVNNGLTIGRRLLLFSQPHRWCLCTQFCHASATCISLVSCLCYGATLVIQGPVFQAKEVLQTIRQERCTVLLASPALYIDMMDAVSDHSLRPDSIVVAAIGSAPVYQQLVHDIKKAFGVQRINAMYGMTETSPLTFQSLPSDTVQQTASTVGVVTDHMEAKVVDSEGRMVPMGTPGELWVRGYAIMLGYWGEEDKTKGIITPGGWLKTGDQFVLQEGGYGRVVGRLKDMIIRDNVNIFPVEVEEFLTTHPDVMEVQAFGVPDPRMGEEMCACIRHREGVVLSEQQLRTFCREKVYIFQECASVRREELKLKSYGWCWAVTSHEIMVDRRFNNTDINEQGFAANFFNKWLAPATYILEHLADYMTPRYFKLVLDFPRTATGKVDKMQLKKSVMQELHII